MARQKFQLKQEHLKLLKNAFIDWNDTEYGAPTICPKRPFGGDVYEDMSEILGLKIKYDEPDSKQIAQMDVLYKELETALQIVLRCQTFRPGIYVRNDEYSQDWKFLK